jgi:hypothetical protein
MSSYLDRFKQQFPDAGKYYSDDEIISFLPKYDPETFAGLDLEQIRFKATDNRTPLRRGFSAGVDQLQAMGGGLIGIAGDVVGSDRMRDFGLGIYERNMEEASLSAPETNFLDIDSIGGAANWAAYTLGNLAPMMGTSVVGGVAGGILAKKFVQKAAQETAESYASRNVLKEVAEREAQRQVGTAATVGQAAGSWGASSGMITGSLYGETEDAGVSAIHGIIAGGIDALPIMRVLGKYGAAAQAKKQIETSVVRELLTQAPLEGGTEFLQTLIEQHAVYWVENEGASLFANRDDIDWNELIEATAAGTLGGAAMGGGASALRRDPLVRRSEPKDSEPNPTNNANAFVEFAETFGPTQNADQAVENYWRFNEQFGDITLAAETPAGRLLQLITADLQKHGVDINEVPARKPDLVREAQERAQQVFGGPALPPPTAPITRPGAWNNSAETIQRAEAAAQDVIRRGGDELDAELARANTLVAGAPTPQTTPTPTRTPPTEVEQLIDAARQSQNESQLVRLENARRAQIMAQQFAEQGNQARSDYMNQRAQAIIADVRGTMGDQAAPRRAPFAVEQAEATPTGEPISVWTGRRMNREGFPSRQAAEQSLGSRQRAEPDLNWRIEALPSGRFRLAGYSPQQTTPILDTALDGASQATAIDATQAVTPIENPAPVSQPETTAANNIQVMSSGRAFSTEAMARASSTFRQNPGSQIVAVGTGFGVSVPVQQTTTGSIDGNNRQEGQAGITGSADPSSAQAVLYTPPAGVGGNLDARGARAKAQDALNRDALNKNTPPTILGDPDPALESALTEIGSALGSTAIVGYSDTSPESASGFELDGVMYVNLADVDVNIGRTGWHENFHVIERVAKAQAESGKTATPEQKFVESMYSLFDDMSDAGKRAYIEKFLHRDEIKAITDAAKREAFIKGKLTNPNTRSEMTADFLGNRAVDRKFLADLAKADPTGFEAFVKRWIEILDNLIESLRGKFQGDDTHKSLVDSYVSDLESSKALVRDALIALRKGQIEQFASQQSSTTTDTATDTVTDSVTDKPLPAIVTTNKKKYLAKMATAARVRKGSPGYADAMARLEEQYETDLDKAYAQMTFEQYNELNKDTPEDINRQAHDALRDEFGDDTKFSKKSKPEMSDADSGAGIPRRQRSMLADAVTNAVAGIKRVAASLTPTEQAKLRKDTAAKLMEIYRILPSSDEIAAVAYAGRAKRGWYRHSVEAIEHIFGEDGWRFAALLAATSPQNSVEVNLENTLRIWKNWIAAGRPTSEPEILAIMGRSVQGNKGEESVLGAWRNNSYRALTANSFADVVLSGPKVDSFMRNLNGNYVEVTNDAWMANYSLIDQNLFSGGMNKAGTDPGKGPGYLAMAAKTREAAKKLGWQPAEVQETVWSWAMSLLEMMDRSGESRGAVALLEQDALSDDVINATPDFRSLFRSPRYAEILESAGYSDRVDTLPAAVRDEDSGVAPFKPEKMRKLLTQAGLRLEFLQVQRRTNVQLSWEARPGESTGILPGIHTAPLEQQQEYLAAIFAAMEAAGFTEKTGFSLRNTLFGPGAWQGKVLAGAQTITRPGIVADNKGSVKVDSDTRRKLEVISSIIGLVLKQEGVYWHYPVYKSNVIDSANGVEIQLGRSLTNSEMQRLYDIISKKAGHTMWAPANTPTGARVLNFTNTPNKDFHKVVKSAAAQFAKKFDGHIDTKQFSADGAAIENNWRENPNGHDYSSRISQARRPDLLEWANGELQTAVDAVNSDFIGRYGWDKGPGEINFSRRSESTRDRGGRDSGRGDSTRESTQALPGVPQVEGATGPDPRLVSVAEKYALDNNIPYERQPAYVDIDVDRARRLADAYAEMPHAPNDPRVREAYADMIRQARSQYDALVADGYEFTFFDGDTDPYAGNPFNAMRDLRQNKRMAVYGTYDGYGTEGITGAAVESNPMLVETDLEWVDQNGESRPVTANDLFRAVHDAFGHGLEGAGFRARGEENAWQAHARLFTGPALAALTTETRGQNSWLNYGPLGATNRNAKLEDTVFAEQKTGLMPDWTWQEGRVTSEAEPDARFSRRQTETPEFKRWFGDSKVVDADGKPLVVYHGTDKTFNEFSERKAGSKGVSDAGIFFSETPGATAPFATWNWDKRANRPKGLMARIGLKETAPQTMPVYVSIKNPYQAEGMDANVPPTPVLQKQGYDGVQWNTGNGLKYWVAFKPAQIKSAIGNDGSFDANNPDIRFSKRTTWYKSELQENIGKLRQMANKQGMINKGVAKQWIESGTKKGLFKAEEVEWTGLMEFIDMADGKLSVADIQAFVDANGVEVQDVTLGDSGMDRLEQVFEDEGYTLSTDEEGMIYEDAEGMIVSLEELPAKLRKAVESEGGPDKYRNYQLPGGTNYREVLLTLPTKPLSEAEARKVLGVDKDAKLSESDIAYASRKNREEYKSNHWDQPNVLAHIRMNDRIDAEGNKTLFIEEVQSDYGQAARKEGIKRPFNKTSEIVDARTKLSASLREDGNLGFDFTADAVAAIRDNADFADRWDVSPKLRELGESYRALVLEREASYKGVPDAPFIGNTKAWTTLALKRIMAMAAEGGYDKVAFINGEQSAERYDLSKQVSEISYNPTTKTLIAKDLDGKNVVNRRGVEQADLADIVGKGVADNLIAQSEDFKGGLTEFEIREVNGKFKIYGADGYMVPVDGIIGTSFKTYGDAAAKAMAMEGFGREAADGRLPTVKGDGLRVGGEGMKSFYDQIVPAALKDLAKKLGGGQIESVNLPGTESKDALAAKVYGRGETYRNLPSENKRTIDRMYSDRLINQPGITITDAMRDKMADGIPLFSKKQKDNAADQTNTPAFKKWFGDSKVVDDNGDPLVVYHGTGSADIKKFKELSANNVFFFTDNTRVADGYAIDRSKGYWVGSGTMREGPFETRAEAMQFKRTEGGGSIKPAGNPVVYPVYLSIQNPMTIDADGKGWNQIKKKGITIDSDGYWYVSAEMKQKYDGLVVLNVQDNTDNSSGELSTVYVAFSPKQIKSAIGNRGTFDASNPDIRFSRAEVQPIGYAAGPRIEKSIEGLAKVRLVFEAAADKLKRTPGLENLGEGVKVYYDRIQANRGAVAKPERTVIAAMKKLSRSERNKAKEDFANHRAAVENGRQAEADQILAAANPALQTMINQWQVIADKTGEMAREAGTQVFDAKTGKWRDMGKVEKFWPRTMNEATQRALDNPHRYPEQYNRLVEAIQAQQGFATLDEAADYIHKYRTEVQDTQSQNDYFAGIEKGRSEPLPEIFYDYSWDAGMLYKESWADRLAQIQAFGQETPGNKDLFGKTMENVRDEHTRNFIMRVAQRVYNQKIDDPVANAVQFLNTLATGLQLGNPGTAVLNLIGGTTLTTQSFGVVSSFKSLLKTVKDFKQYRELAYDIGVAKDDYLAIMHDSEQANVPKWLQKMTSKLMQVGGYTPTEHFIRTHAMVTGMSFLRDALKAFNTNPASTKAATYAKWLQQNDFDVDKLVMENGQGEYTNRFIRYAVNLPQGSYKVDQTPVFVDTPTGRFLFKYQKFGTQLTRMFWMNHLKPFVDTVTGNNKVTYEIDGKEYSARLYHVMPLLRFFALAALSGGLLMDWREKLFGYQNKAPTLSQIDKALQDDDTAKAVALGAERAFQGILALGGVGILSNYAQMMYDVADRQRVKSPLDPPALAPLKSFGELGMRLFEQGGLSGRDIDNFIMGNVALYRTTKRAASTELAGLTNWREMHFEAAKKDVAFVQKMTRLYADDVGIEARRRSTGRFGATENTIFNTKVYEAILLGDAQRARLMVREHLRDRERFANPAERRNARQSLNSSIRTRDPARVGASPSDATRVQFLRWAKENTTAEEYARIKRVSDQYRTTARRAGLL